MKIKLCEEDKKQLLDIAENRRVYLEGNIVKLIDPGEDNDFKVYLQTCQEKDTDNRKKRLEMTRQVQDQNKELEEKAKENDALMIDLKDALKEAEGAKEAAVNDLDLMQKKTQFELIGNIVNVALWIIVGVGVMTTILYMTALFTKGSGADTTLIGNTWSNLLGILLTNSFSIIGTIMGVKYASESGKKEDK
jgi:flagellar biosynthesis regulator FlaF